MATKKRETEAKPRHPGGRPSHGLDEDRRLVSGPALLMAAMDAKAAGLGVSSREVWRRAARAWLGWPEVPEASADSASTLGR